MSTHNDEDIARLDEWYTTIRNDLLNDTGAIKFHKTQKWDYPNNSLVDIFDNPLRSVFLITDQVIEFHKIERIVIKDE
jgi:hypothetical protein